jgi:hypothetical protein
MKSTIINTKTGQPVDMTTKKVVEVLSNIPSISEAEERWRHVGLVVDRLPEDKMDRYVGIDRLHPNDMILVAVETGGPTDMFKKRGVWLTGIQRSHAILKAPRVGAAISYIETKPMYEIQTLWKSTADQIKAFDLLRDQMLGALSFLGYREDGNKR